MPVTDPAPETYEILPLVKGLIEATAGGVGAPRGRRGELAPAAVAHGKPERRRAGERRKAARCARHGGDLGGVKEGENIDLDVVGQLGEGRRRHDLG
jgi:hypothetical protein